MKLQKDAPLINCYSKKTKREDIASSIEMGGYAVFGAINSSIIYLF